MANQNKKTTILQRKTLRQLVVLTTLFYVVFPSTAPCRCLDCHCCKARTVQVNASCATVCCQNKTSCPCSAKKKSKESRLKKEFCPTTSFSHPVTPCRCPCSKTGNLTKTTFITLDDIRSTKSTYKKDTFNLYKHLFDGRMLQIDEKSNSTNAYETPVSRLHIRLHLMLCVLLN